MTLPPNVLSPVPGCDCDGFADVLGAGRDFQGGQRLCRDVIVTGSPTFSAPVAISRADSV